MLAGAAKTELLCPFQIKDYEKLDSEEERLSRSRQIYDGYIMKELLSCSHVRTCSRTHPADALVARHVRLSSQRLSYRCRLRSTFIAT